MKNLITYLSIAPVVLLAWILLISSFLIEFNRFFPDWLTA